MDRIDQILTRKRMNPRFVLWPPGAYFSDNHHSIRIGMTRSLDDLIGHMRTIKIARIDVVDPGRDSLSQNSYRCLSITRRSPNLRAGKLHGAITHPVHIHGSTGQREASAKFYLFRHFVSPLLLLNEASFNNRVFKRFWKRLFREPVPVAHALSVPRRDSSRRMSPESHHTNKHRKVSTRHA